MQEVSRANGHAAPAGQNGGEVDAIVRELVERNRQLEQALESRVVIEQAKGMLAERLGTTPDDAFEVLRRAARNHRLKIHALARRVVAEPSTPPEIAELAR